MEIKIEQSTTEWHDFRRSKIGSSEIATVLGINPFQTPLQLWEIKTGLTKAPDLSNNFAVKRGIELEPIARNIFNEMTSSKFNPAVFNHETIDFIGYSSDGYDPEKEEIIEIKCLGEKNHLKVMELKAPLDYYYPQCQIGMFLSNTTRCHFISYSPSNPDPIYYVTVLEDKDYQEKLLNAAKKFWHLVETKTPPPLSEKDFKIVENSETKTLADLYRRAIQDEKEAKDRLASIKEKIKQTMGNQRTKFYGFKCHTGSRVGSVDYGKVPELKGVDLDKYRKASTEIFYISETEKVL